MDAGQQQEGEKEKDAVQAACEVLLVSSVAGPMRDPLCFYLHAAHFYCLGRPVAVSLHSHRLAAPCPLLD
jgi:hypothetical protein